MLVRLMVSWVHPQVMMFLGKVKNPTTDTMERNLDAARTLIDVLAELQSKTEGRLDPDDQRLLQHTLTELRMNWLDESNKDAGGAPADGGGGGADDVEDPAAGPTPSAGGTPPAGL
ncbi:MAG TPA: DUF1844 domain-containing protein [Candidatus Eisenbacteria bacterium]